MKNDIGINGSGYCVVKLFRIVISKGGHPKQLGNKHAPGVLSKGLH